MPSVAHKSDPRPGYELLRDPPATGRAVIDGMFMHDSQWRHTDWQDAGSELAAAYSEIGQEVLDLAEIPGDLGASSVWDLLERGDLRTLRARIGLDPEIGPYLPTDDPEVSGFLAMRLRPYVEGAVIRVIGDTVEWVIDWSGPASVSTPAYDIEQLTDDLFAGGEAAAGVRAQLEADVPGHHS